MGLSNHLYLIDLIDAFLVGELSPHDFEVRYMETWRRHRSLNDKSIIGEETQHYLDAVFCSLDAYCLNPALRDENDLDDEGLLSEVRSLNEKWRNGFPQG